MVIVNSVKTPSHKNQSHNIFSFLHPMVLSKNRPTSLQTVLFPDFSSSSPPNHLQELVPSLFNHSLSELSFSDGFLGIRRWKSQNKLHSACIVREVLFSPESTVSSRAGSLDVRVLLPWVHACTVFPTRAIVPELTEKNLRRTSDQVTSGFDGKENKGILELDRVRVLAAQCVSLQVFPCFENNLHTLPLSSACSKMGCLHGMLEGSLLPPGHVEDCFSTVWVYRGLSYVLHCLLLFR